MKLYKYEIIFSCELGMPMSHTPIPFHNRPYEKRDNMTRIVESSSRMSPSEVINKFKAEFEKEPNLGRKNLKIQGFRELEVLDYTDYKDDED